MKSLVNFPDFMLEAATNVTTSQYSGNTSSTVEAITEANEKQSSGLSASYILVPLGILVFLVLVTGLVAILIRKKRLDKLRHHLMPLYSFDPAEEGEDWEAELLEEGTDHRPIHRGKNTGSQEQPQLSFRGPL